MNTHFPLSIILQTYFKLSFLVDNMVSQPLTVSKIFLHSHHDYKLLDGDSHECQRLKTVVLQCNSKQNYTILQPLKSVVTAVLD